MKFRPKFFYRLQRPADGDGSDLGGAAVVDTPVDTVPAAPVAGSDAGAMEAMFGKTEQSTDPLPGETPEATAQRLRDEQGRFAKKPDETVPPVEPLKKTEPGKDATAMPEGLTPKAQERFQTLANTNKELAAKVQEFQPMVESAQALQQTFVEHGVQREQFDQAVNVIGLMNRGDWQGAQQVLEEQLRLISLHTGRPVNHVDALQGFPDLREQVDGLQLTEQNALVIARARAQQDAQQQAQQTQQQQERQAQQTQQAVQEGQRAVDTFAKSKMKTDLDYAKIEPLLMEQLQGGLLEGIPPSRWAAVVQKTYDLVKQSAAMNRSPSTGGGVLRPSGGDPVKAAPKNAFEAMWGSSPAA